MFLDNYTTKCCEADDYFTDKVKFCKRCGIYLSKIKDIGIGLKLNNLKVNPNKIYMSMIKNLQVNRYYNENYNHKNYRSQILKKVKYICDELHFSVKTYNVAINYIDSVLSRYEIEIAYMDLLILLCISYSSKLHENIQKSVNYQLIYNNFKHQYSMNIIRKFDNFILKLLDWNLNITTPYDFYEYYLSYGCIYEREVFNLYQFDKNAKDVSFDDYKAKFLEKFKNLSNSILEFTNENYELYQFSSIAISCSIISISRVEMGLKAWNESLCELSYIKFDDIYSCVNIISMIYQSKKNKLLENVELVTPNNRKKVKHNFDKTNE